MLSSFLKKNQAEIVAIALEKTRSLAGGRKSSHDLEKGLPNFLNQLITYLDSPKDHPDETGIVAEASRHGLEMLRLNYTLSHVVHAYGSVCQAITGLAQSKSTSISSQSFNDLNMCLDIAIAAAVSEFEFRSVSDEKAKGVQSIGFLVHELRNALSSATVAHEMIKKGLVGVGGSTSKVLEENLLRMRRIIDRSLSEVRMSSDPVLFIEEFDLKDLIDQIVITACADALKKSQKLINNAESSVFLKTDRQLLLSAIANVVQNAIKYTKENGTITLHAVETDDAIAIEVADECGGISEDLLSNIFKPFVSGTADRSGLGLGMTIVQRSIEFLQGTVEVHNHPGHGCAFVITVPKIIEKKSKSWPVTGENSAQPKITRT
ncbi:MAG: HAMP domain-containing histidine kinase [Bdellovibrionales bacterium]|nr:HAMP domain-containing histidine kinase [Bdellovibrionales bacterium]